MDALQVLVFIFMSDITQVVREILKECKIHASSSGHVKCSWRSNKNWAI